MSRVPIMKYVMMAKSTIGKTRCGITSQKSLARK